MGNFFDGFGDGEVGNTFDGLEGAPAPSSGAAGPPPPGLVMQPVVAVPLTQQVNQPNPAFFLQQRPAAEPNPDQEIEERFYKASLYRDLINAPLFDQADAVALEVQAECQEFYRRRLQESMAGESPASRDAVLTDERRAVLALVADAVLRSPQLQGALGVAPQAVAAVVVAAPKPRPQVRARQAGTPTPAAPTRPQPATAPRAIRKQPPPAPAARGRQEQRKVTAPGDIPADGLKVEGENGRRHLVRHVPMASKDEYGIEAAKQLDALAAGAAVVLPNGVQVFRDGSGDYVKVVYLDLTRQVKDPTAAAYPTLSREGMEYVTASRAAEGVAQAPASLRNLGSAFENS